MRAYLVYLFLIFAVVDIEMKSASREKKQETGCGKKGRHVWRRLSYAALIALYFTSFALLCFALLCFVLLCFVLF